MPIPDLPFDVAPYRLSGTVYGVLMNDPAALAALGAKVLQPPYKRPPKAPVLYIKPRNTLAVPGEAIHIPADDPEFELGASLGLVIGRTACRVSETHALEHIAGYTIVADFSVPHSSFYRPSIRFKARDASCLLGPRVVARRYVEEPDALSIRVSVDGKTVQNAGTAGMLRPVARLLADVTEFMTLRTGDVLMLGVPHGAPHVHAGQAAAIEIDGLGRLECRFVTEPETVA
jgi:5-oxopent-3-ene-1,2,5-tricarboxylate decarboxylase / 2-hydroxyhepta-2,4-diene-1,7-dioate isomerase